MSPIVATAASARICPIARIVLPITLPASRVRAEMVDSRISTTRVCFSSTTLCAIVPPKVAAAPMKTAPNAIAMKYRSSGFVVAGSRISTSGACESADTRLVGASLRATIVTLVGPSPGTTAASTFSERTSSSAAAWSATSVISRPGRADTADAVSEVTATGIASVFLLAKPPITMAARARISRMPVEIRKALLRSFDPISRSATSQISDACDGEPVVFEVLTG